MPTDPQLQLAFHQAVNGMNRALAHAKRTEPDWDQVAKSFMLAYLARHEVFISEDISGAFREAGHPLPPTDRAWGAVYRWAMKNKFIVNDGAGRSMRRHGSICPRWRSTIYLPGVDRKGGQE